MRKVFQLNDSDYASIGLIVTNLSEKTITKDWKDFYPESADVGADTFAKYLNKKYPHSDTQRFFVDAEINL